MVMINLICALRALLSNVKISCLIFPQYYSPFIFCFLTGYFKVMKVLIEEKIPSSLERTIKPPTPIAGSILDLVKTPILHVTEYEDPEFRFLKANKIRIRN